MNIELLQRVRDQIAAQPEHFSLDMFATDASKRYRHDDDIVDINACGTLFCVGGTAVVINDGPQSLSFKYEVRARELLGLTVRQAESLFYPRPESPWSAVADEFGWEKTSQGWVANWSSITAEQAVIVLDRIISGEIVL